MHDGVAAVAAPGLRRVLCALRDLFALHTIEREIGQFTVDGYLSHQQAEWVSEALRPDAVALVDSFGFHHELELALGADDGRPYERLWEWSEKDPANHVGPGPTGSGIPGGEHRRSCAMAARQLLTDGRAAILLEMNNRGKL
eukprot:gene3102-19054_t